VLLYIRVPALESEAQWRTDPVLSIVGMRQYVDWRPLRHLDVRTPTLREQIERFCDKIVEALRAPWVSPEERRKKQEVEAQQRAEERRAETVRQAEAERQQAEEEKQRTEAARQAEAERQQAEEEKQRVAAAAPVKDLTTDNFMVEVVDGSFKAPVIVDFWAPWCDPCKQLGPILQKTVRATGGAIRLVKLNIDENPKIAQHMRIQSIPAVYAFKDGRPVDGFVGALPEGQVEKFVQRLVRG
jgi:thioredoxin